MPLQVTAGTGTLQITQVDTQAPDSTNNIPNAIDSTRDLQVIVESNFDPSLGNPELTCTDNGPRTDMSKQIRKTKKYRPFKILQKPQPVERSSALPGSAPPPPPIGRVFQMFYLIPSSDLLPAHNYTLVATVSTLTSPSVTFHTAP
jgi:hypothetical protein